MQTLEQAITQYGQCENFCKYQGVVVSLEELNQITAWLRELQERRKAPEIITCGECRWNDGTCYCNFHYRNVRVNDYCSWSERKTNG